MKSDMSYATNAEIELQIKQMKHELSKLGVNYSQRDLILQEFDTVSRQLHHAQLLDFERRFSKALVDEDNRYNAKLLTVQKTQENRFK